MSAQHGDLVATTLTAVPTVSLGSPSLPTGTLTRASTDDELIELWLRRPNLSPRTVRNAGKEAERFLFWIRTRGLTLRTVAYEDLVAYAGFLANPQPAEQWIRSERYARTDPRWRPFCGPLAEVSQVQALVILKGMFRWARAAEYLAHNPASLLGSMRVMPDETVSRFLPPLGISLLLAAADDLPAATPAAALRRGRARFLVQAFYLTGVRLSELTGADMRSLRRDDAGAWWLHVLGKGLRHGAVPAPAALLDEYRAYRRAYGLPPMPAVGESLPLILSSRGPLRRMSHSAVAGAVLLVMRGAVAMAIARGQYELADRLEHASTHWLRHSALTHQVDSGIPLKTVQKNGRHASISTTGRYVHKEDATRHAETIAAVRILPLDPA